MRIKYLIILGLLSLLSGCGSRFDLAPVSELSAWTYAAFKKTHTVRRGETLYAIAFHYDSDYRQLARLNHLRPPYTLRIGQVLTLKGLVKKQGLARRKTKTFSRPIFITKPKIIHSPWVNRPSALGWLWPANGHVMNSFIPSQGKKGIDIASKKGEKVYAAHAGTVAYSGSGLAGYGNLIIIKHNNEYLTAYGNNARNLVKEGQSVKAKQVIAEIGVIDHKFWGVHFEIRRAGQPVNPLNYLQKG